MEMCSNKDANIDLGQGGPVYIPICAVKNDIAMVLEGTAGYMCIEKAIAEILRRREPSMCIE